MIEAVKIDDLVFGLDIGTRNVVGTVGYKTDNGFHVLSQCSRVHKTKAMLDGQIHDISRVADTIREIKETIESDLDTNLPGVCIAAAGRVLKTITTNVSMEFEEEHIVTNEDLHTLDLMGVDKATREIADSDTDYKFYCVGYSVMKYYLNDEIFTSLEGHKATKIEETIIVTFLPEDVVDGLYSAVERAGLSVLNLTLEPIAAINIAIPQNFRMLNIALVDVGAGTSDICITKDGSITAYGMIPDAGDALTNAIVQQFLVDFSMAEKIKMDASDLDNVQYVDIMGISHTIPSKDVWELTDPIVDRMTTEVADKIVELNGGKPVAAVFIVGGGGKVHGYTKELANKLDIVEERVALRGEEVLKEVTFEQTDIEKDPLIVTPVGICLNYYESKNNFVMIRFNGEMMKLFDNGKLTIIDAAMQAGLSTDELFPRRGGEIHFIVNGKPRVLRGTAGESAVIKLNGREAGLNTPLEFNCDVTVETSTIGEDAVRTISQLDEYNSEDIVFDVNGRTVTCPKFVDVNGKLEPGSYLIKDGDDIETRNYYTVAQIAEFMDVKVDESSGVSVNNRPASLDAKVYENFTVEFTSAGDKSSNTSSSFSVRKTNLDSFVDEGDDNQSPVNDSKSITGILDDNSDGGVDIDTKDDVMHSEEPAHIQESSITIDIDAKEDDMSEPDAVALNSSEDSIRVIVNGEEKVLSGKSDYMFVDVFNVIDFDIHSGKGKAVVTRLNGEKCGYVAEIKDGDEIEIFWEER